MPYGAIPSWYPGTNSRPGPVPARQCAAVAMMSPARLCTTLAVQKWSPWSDAPAKSAPTCDSPSKLTAVDCRGIDEAREAAPVVGTTGGRRVDDVQPATTSSTTAAPTDRIARQRAGIANSPAPFGSHRRTLASPGPVGRGRRPQPWFG